MIYEATSRPTEDLMVLQKRKRKFDNLHVMHIM